MGDTSYSSVIRIGSTTPQSHASYFSSPSLSKVNWAFWFCVTETASYCFYNLYQALQLKNHTGLGLDDRLKLTKCQALYAEAIAKEDFEKAKPLLQECQDLLASITDRTHSHDIETLLVNLACYYAKNDPKHAYKMTNQFSSSLSTLRVVQSIQEVHPHFFRLGELFIQAFLLQQQEDKKPNPYRTPSEKLGTMLQFAKTLNSLQNQNLFSCAIKCEQKAIEIANSIEKKPARLSALCRIAESYRGNHNATSFQIESAQTLLTDEFTDAEKIEAHLNLAHAYFSIKAFTPMDQHLDQVLLLVKQIDPVTTAKNLYPLAILIDKINKTKNIESKFKEYAVEIHINAVFKALEDEATDRKEAALTIATIYQEELLKDTSHNKERALKIAFDEIQKLPDEADEVLNQKIESLTHLSHYYEKDHGKTLEIIESLKRLYELCPAKCDRNSRLRWEKPGLGMQIVDIYNKAGLQEESKVFFQNYLTDLQNGNDTVEKINRLTNHVTGTPEQIKAQLEIAEALLPQINSLIHYKHALSLIIEEYSKIDPQKSMQILNNYENRQANRYIVNAVATPALLGISYYLPTAGLVTSQLDLSFQRHFVLHAYGR